MAFNDNHRRSQPYQLRTISRFRGLLCLLLLWACDGPAARDDALVLLLPREPLEVDPRFAADTYSLKVTRLLFSSLVTIDQGTLRPRLDLAAAIEVRTPIHYLVTLHPNLRFSDGSALDAHDVAETFRGIVSEKLASRYRSTYQRIQQIQVHDPLRLTFVLAAPHATFMTDLEMPIMRAEDAYAPVGRDRPVISSGPYALRARSRSELLLVHDRNHHRPAPRFPRLRLRVVRDDNIRVLRLLTGAGDVALEGIGPLLLPLFAGREDFAVVTARGVGTRYLGIQTAAPKLKDVRVRQALAYAIDRALIIEKKLHGRARLATSFVPPGHWAHDDDVLAYAYDPARARALLADAGVSRPLHLTLRCNSERETLSLARVIVAMLQQVGIEVTVRSTETSTLLADLNHGQFELALMHMPELLEPHLLSWFFGSDHIPGAGVEGANRWRLRDAELDYALEQGRSHTDVPERIHWYHEAQRRLAATLPVVPLWHEDVVGVVGRRATGLGVSRHGRFDALLEP